MENNTKNANDTKIFWNIFKCIGIVFIVMGHCSPKFSKFVYLFHLSLFFFVGGYLYTKEKYLEKPWEFFVSRCKSNWKKYVKYSLLVLYFHNFFLHVGIISGVEHFRFVDFVINTINTFLFMGQESMVGALWFVPVYLASSIIFSLMLFYINKYLKNKKIKYVYLFISTLLFGGVGMYLVNKGCVLAYNMQIAFLVIPFYTLGFILRNNIKDLSKFLNMIVCVISVIVLYYIMNNDLLSVDLAQNVVDNFILYYLCGICGIYLTLYLSKIISKLNHLSKIVSDIGSYSFEIMTFHFLVFKLIDLSINIPAFINNTAVLSEYSRFPYAYEKAWPLYISLGVLIPYLSFKLINSIKLKIKKHNNKIKIA